MLTTLDLICEQWHISIDGATPQKPIEVPDVSRHTSLPELFRLAQFKVGVEVGVAQGLYSEHLCTLIPDLELYAVDSWTAYRGYRDYHHRGYRNQRHQVKLDSFYEEAQKKLAPYNCTLIREWSVEAAKQFEDSSLDFVYIDANHDFANVVKDIAAWSPKVRKGGVVAGHDFRSRKVTTTYHVVAAVCSWTKCYSIAPWFVLGRWKAKIPGELRDNPRSWMWVKC